MIRGKGSVKTQSQSFISRPLPGEDEPLHALISANCQTSVEDAIRTIRQIIKDAIENPEGQNDLRKKLSRISSSAPSAVDEDTFREIVDLAILEMKSLLTGRWIMNTRLLWRNSGAERKDHCLN